MGFILLAAGIAALTLGLAIALGNWLPRFSAYLLGPCAFVFAAGCLFFGRREIFGSHYDVAIPGNFAPIIIGIPLAFLALVGVVLVASGLAHIQRADEAGENLTHPARDTQEFSRFRPRESAWLTPRKLFVLVAGVEFLVVLALVAFYR